MILVLLLKLDFELLIVVLLDAGEVEWLDKQWEVLDDSELWHFFGADCDFLIDSFGWWMRGVFVEDMGVGAVSFDPTSCGDFVSLWVELTELYLSFVFVLDSFESEVSKLLFLSESFPRFGLLVFDGELLFRLQSEAPKFVWWVCFVETEVEFVWPWPVELFGLEEGTGGWDTLSVHP